MCLKKQRPHTVSAKASALVRCASLSHRIAASLVASGWHFSRRCNRTRSLRASSYAIRWCRVTAAVIDSDGTTMMQTALADLTTALPPEPTDRYCSTLYGASLSEMNAPNWCRERVSLFKHLLQNVYNRQRYVHSTFNASSLSLILAFVLNTVNSRLFKCKYPPYFHMSLYVFCVLCLLMCSCVSLWNFKRLLRKLPKILVVDVCQTLIEWK